MRLFYITYHIAYFLGSIASRALNAILFRGSMHQTLSARAWVESRSSAAWEARRAFIDRAIFWERNHCEESWASEVEIARKTLERNAALENWTEPRPITRKDVERRRAAWRKHVS